MVDHNEKMEMGRLINKLNSYTPEVRNSMKRFINEK